MIPNIIIPTMMRGGGSGDSKVVVALLLAIFIIGALIWIVGFIYDGLKHKRWTWRLVNMGFAKMLGMTSMSTSLAIAFGVVLFRLISALL